MYAYTTYSLYFLYRMSSIVTLPSHMAGFLHELGPPASGVYSYVSYPTVLPPNNHSRYQRYRNSDINSGSSGGFSSGGANSGPVNIMHDPRVVRGNTYSQRPVRTGNVFPGNRIRKVERQSYVKKRMLPSIGSSARPGVDNHRPLSSEDGFTAARARVRKRLSHLQQDQEEKNQRKHLDIQTEQWLEEIKDRAPEAEAAVQTEESGEAAVAPVRELAPVATIDRATQVLPDDPELFDFDEEVTLVLEAVVGRTVEQSLLEVLEEEEDYLAATR